MRATKRVYFWATLVAVFAGGEAAASEFWARTFGASNFDDARSVVATVDDGFVVAGTTRSFGAGSEDVWVVKVNGSGVVEWERVLGGTGVDMADGMDSTCDGGVVMAGVSQGTLGNRGWLLRLDPAGGLLWERHFPDSAALTAVSQSPDGGFVAAGLTFSFGPGGGDFYVTKTDANGDLVWQKAYGGTGFELAAAIRPTPDGGYVVAGRTDSFGAGGTDVWVLRLDATGSIVWQGAYGGPAYDGSTYTNFHRISIEPTFDGGFVLAALTESFGVGSSSLWLVKLDGTGTPQWQNAYSSGSTTTGPHGVQQTPDGGFVTTGAIDFSYDFLALKLSATGAIEWQHTFGSSSLAPDLGQDVALTNDGGYAFTGLTASVGAGQADAWLLKLDQAGGIGTSCALSATPSLVVTPTNVTMNGTSVTPVALAGASSPVNPANSPTAAIVQQQCFSGCGAADFVVEEVLLSDNGDHDGFADTNETVNLQLVLRNTTQTQLTGVSIGIAVLAADASKIDTVGPAATVPGSWSAGAQIVVNTLSFSVASVNRVGAFDLFTAGFAVSVASDQCPTLELPRPLTFDLDLDVVGGSGPTQFFESFEGGMATFHVLNLDSGLNSLAASDGYRCQYDDPGVPGSNTFGALPAAECFLGVSAAQAGATWWQTDTPLASDGGRAFSGVASLYYGQDAGVAPGRTTPMAVLEAAATTNTINLGWRGVCSTSASSCASDTDCPSGQTCVELPRTLSFKHQVSLMDDRTHCGLTGQSADRGVVMVQLADNSGAAVGNWIKVDPYANRYDRRATDEPPLCHFDPLDDGSTETDYFAGSTRLGPSSTCAPEPCFSYLGDTDQPYDAANTGRGQGPGLQGSLGPGTWVESRFDLGRFRGRRIRLRFLVSAEKGEYPASASETWEDVLSINPVPGDDGWWIDDVLVTNSLALPATTIVDTKLNTGLSVAAGTVPDGQSSTGLIVGQLGNGDLQLTWSPSCMGSDADYEVFEGLLSTLNSHAPVVCSTGGATSWTLTPSAASTYYLVVPRNPIREGSYGLDSAGQQRPQGVPACLPQGIGC